MKDLVVLYDKDSDPEALKNKTVAVGGFGSQGHAHALGLKESGINTIVAVRKSTDPKSSWMKAEAAGFEVMTPAEAIRVVDVFMMLFPDEDQADIYNKEIAPHIRTGQCLGFAHGFNIHFGQIVVPEGVSVFMVAPKAPGHLVRAQYLADEGVPMLIAVDSTPNKEKTKALALAYACAIKGGKAGVIETTFKEETETDLFGEQVILCGGLTSLITAGYETLVEAGYAPEMAYFECLHEVKLIVDLMYEGGISNMRYSISNTAQYGDLTRGPRIVTEDTKKEMKKILGEIQSGEFARDWILECKANKPVFDALTKKGAMHSIEVVGAKLRAMMPWLNKKKLVDKKKA